MSPGLGMNPHLLLLHHIFTEKLEYIIHDTGIELIKWDPKKYH